MNVALVYDWVDSWGGAERLLLSLHELFPAAPLFTSVYNRKKAAWASRFDVRTSFLQHIPFAKTHHEWFAPLIPIAFESFDFSAFDLVISVSSGPAKGIITRPSTKHIAICLTPTRYLWNQHDDYFRNKVFTTLSKPLVAYLRRWDMIASARPDCLLAISNAVKERIKCYYHQDAMVLYPPVVVDQSHSTHVGQIKQERPTERFFLVVSRLVPYKKVELAIDAARIAKVHLVIIGKGVMGHALKRRAGNTVTFLHDLTDMELSWYYQRCCALLVPQEEDFGLAAIEAQAAGSPVIAYRAGGALETVIEGQTGEFFSPQTPGALAHVLVAFDKTRYAAAACRANAARFNFERFRTGLFDLIKTQHT